MVSAVLEVSGLACRRGGRRVFDNLSFALAGGELLALTGRNGSGKTTLLRALALLVPSLAGEIRWNGADVHDDRENWRARLAWLGHQDGLKSDLTAAENILVAQRLRGQPADVDHLAHALSIFDLTALKDRAVRTLSAGQRRRVALARVVAAKAPLWLLDEPLNALDAPAQKALNEGLARHLAEGGLAIAATHAPLDSARILELGA